MPQIVNCPDCERKLRIPDTMLGKTVQCPSCCVKFKATMAGGANAQEEPSRPKPRQATGREERVSTRPERTSSRGEEQVSRSRRRVEEEEDDRPSRRPRDEDEDQPRSRRSRDDDDYEDRPRSRRSRDDDEDLDTEHERSSWQRVRTGLQLVAIGTWVWIFGFFLGGIFLLLALVMGYHTVSSFDTSSGSGTWGSMGITAICAVVGMIFMGGGGFLELILRVIGYGLCLASPGKEGTGIKPLAIAAFVLVALTTLFKIGNVFLGGVSSFAGNIPGMMGRSGYAASQGSGMLGYLIGLMTFASFVVFLFYLRSVCRHIGERRLGGQMITAFIVFLSYYIVSGIIMVLLILVTVGSTALSLSGNREGGMGGAMTTLGTMAVISILVGCLLALGYLGLHVWYVVLLQKVRAALEGHRHELQG